MKVGAKIAEEGGDGIGAVLTWKKEKKNSFKNLHASDSVCLENEGQKLSLETSG